MALHLDTPLGEFCVDLFVKDSPALCSNVLKLARLGYYDNCIFT
ncbi:hypothetical protein KIPB_015824, partial [Kipferlia bialata]|eukprot:g15824.t1